MPVVMWGIPVLSIMCVIHNICMFTSQRSITALFLCIHWLSQLLSKIMTGLCSKLKHAIQAPIEGVTKGLTTQLVPGVYRVVWNQVSFLVIITHGCCALVCYYHQKAARDSIPHGKHLERGC